MHFRTMLEKQRTYFRSGATLPLGFRLEQLRRLRQAVTLREYDLLEALRSDLKKPPMEAYTTEIGFVLSDIDHAIRKLARWMRVKQKPLPPIVWPGNGAVRPEPYGVVLIVGPWNYPFQLLLSPLVGAVAAGNCACIKPSEFTPHTSHVVSEVIRKAFPPEYLRVIEGDDETAGALLRERFDYIFFTGSTAVGRAVMVAAARHLTPVTLELGGKSPCIVCADARLPVAARRILWGKCLNAGQTCVAPDFVLVDEAVRDRLLDALRAAGQRFFPSSPRESPHLGRIVNRKHFDRLVSYLGQGRTVLGGEYDAEDLFIAPTILVDVDPEAPVMHEEIFGPILPVLKFGSLDDAFRLLSGRPKPLALYAFTENRSLVERIIAETSSGGVCINDTISHIMGKAMPFGGLGDSGMGTYHGRATFDCFTHYRSVMRRGTLVDPGFRYPPLSVSLGVLRRMYGWLIGR